MVNCEIFKMADLHAARNFPNVIRRIDAAHLKPKGIQNKVEGVWVRIFDEHIHNEAPIIALEFKIVIVVCEGQAFLSDVIRNRTNIRNKLLGSLLRRLVLGWHGAESDGITAYQPMLLNDSIQVILQTVEGRMGDTYVQFQFTDEVGKPLWFYVAEAGNLNRIESLRSVRSISSGVWVNARTVYNCAPNAIIWSPFLYS